MERTVSVPAGELERQRELGSQVRALAGGGHYHIKTYGCQMNVMDSQRLAGMLGEMGYEETDDETRADVIVLNTCCVRGSAEQRVYGNIGGLKHLWEANRGLIICVCGCMMQQQGAPEELLSRFPFVKVVFGTNSVYRLPELLLSALKGGRRLVCVDGTETIAEGLPVRRDDSVCAYTTIMYGCDNFCSYCIVPYVRGRERSRHPDLILRELDSLVSSGVREVTLLGQNVNSYGRGTDYGSFAGLLRGADGAGLERLRFMTSHPKDISDEVLETMAGGRHICRQLHLPVQSGSDRVLAAMNRRYTVERYMGIVERARALMPGLGLSTDIIVGFPGETDADFEATLALVRAARFDSAFTFVYSPRRGTPAAEMPGQIPEEVKKARIMELIRVQDEIGGQTLRSLLGSVQRVLVDGFSRREGGLSGRTERGHTVNFDGGEHLRGALVDVRITGVKHNTLMGAL